MSIVVDEIGLTVDPDGWAGLVTGEAPHEDLERAHDVPGTREALAAARRPAALLEVSTLTPGGPRQHLGWVAEASVALLVDLGAEQHRVLSFSPDQLPAALARLIGLGPRWQRESASVEVEARELEETLSGESRALLERLDADRAWTLSLGPVGGTEDDLLMASGVDGAGGCWLVVPEADALVARRVAPREVWRLLSGALLALPLPEDLERPGDSADSDSGSGSGA